MGKYRKYGSKTKVKITLEGLQNNRPATFTFYLKIIEYDKEVY